MKRLAIVNLLFFLAVSLYGQNLKSPDEFLGYELGTRFTPNYKVVDYFEYVASELSNVTHHKYGETNELRPLVTNMVSSQANIDNWEQIRTDNLKRAKMMEGSPSGKQVGIVWLSYNVHGNEANATETAMKTLYELARPNNAKSKSWLENTVVIIDPCINPDGRDRYSNWINQVAGTTPNPHPEAAEHNEPWPGGRPNHYLFDLNRDWAWQKQTESAQRMEYYHTIMPHIHVDFHEQGSNSPYYFAPAAEPIHEQVTDWQREFQEIIGRNHAKYFDENGWLFFTKESFDILYPSYGDSYPMYNGAIGMTYEQASSDLAILTDEGDTLKLSDAIAHHYTTGMSTVEMASENNERMLNEFASYFDKAVSNPKAKYKTYVVKGSNHPDKLRKLEEFLQINHIRYGKSSTKKPISAFSYQAGETKNVSVEDNDIVISSFQPKAVMVQALFEPDTYASITNTYDITAWAVPYMMGLDAYATTERLSVSDGKPSYAAPEMNVGSRPAAYLAKWETMEDAKFLAEILKAGIKLRYSNDEFTVNGKDYGRGTLIITRKGNMHLGNRFDSIVKEAATKFGRSLNSTPTTFVDSGKDFGSNGVPFLKAPRILALRGDGVSSLGFGEFWYYMEQELNYPITMVNTDDFGRVNLDDYDVVVMPSGSYGSMLNERAMEGFNSWIRSGGTVLAIERAMNTFMGKGGFNLKRYASDAEQKAARNQTDEEKEAAALTPYAERGSRYESSRLPGAIFKLKVDNTHPLGYGYDNHYFTIKNNSSRYAYLPNGWNVGIIESEGSYITGVAGEDAKKNLAKSMVFGVDNVGRGAVVYLADNPLFRAFWENGKLFVANALFFVGQ
ncbi:M14 family metallopeptidase [uncultured Roseivirga sp.]|uniref:M14 family metallopeptidase n=1 Tax=uncultured Roseivirga sp. TaxID=543088 RepID=UPI000D794A8C|nr:M14 family metallopeptidase [uncultured Roseivirga sp.]PWL30636.1 MAG: zinc carboxypeptidase [Roseivirga sp. XM-24bin3]